MPLLDAAKQETANVASATVDAGTADIDGVVRRLLGGPADIRHWIGEGRNSRIYRVRSAKGEFALKQYPCRAEGGRDRLGTEVGALQLMEQFKVANVPRVIASDRALGFALLTWIDGTQVEEVGDCDIEATAGFLRSVHALRHAPRAKSLPLASEACLSGAEIIRQIEHRLSRLAALADEGALQAFLNERVRPELAHLAARAKDVAHRAGINVAAELATTHRTLAPSDFGFHNSLRRKDGSLVFLDFEYFGWDDPVKLTSDILLHPGCMLAPAQRRLLRARAQDIYGADPFFEPRLSAYLPLFGVRWVLILLNEFIPERWNRRVLAGVGGSWTEAKARQLTGAKQFLAALREKMEY